MIVFPVELDQLCLKVKAGLRKDDVQGIQNFFGEHLSAVFGNEDQMNVHQERAVSSVADVWIVAHRLSIITEYKYSDMQRLQAYKFELMPTGDQARDMRRFAGSCRFVFNKALALQKTNHEAGEKFIGYVAMAKCLTDWRNNAATAWLKDSPVHSLQHTLKDLDRAYKNFFAKRSGFPKFKRRGGGESFRYPDSKQFELDQANARIKLPKLGWVRYRKSRDVEGELRNITVSQTCGKWSISIQTQREEPDPIHAQEGTWIGLDLGARQAGALASLSNGMQIATTNAHRRAEQRLKRYQRAYARKVKGSRNQRKARSRLQRQHHKVACIRADHLHKLAHVLTDTFGGIAIEDLKVRQMTSSTTNPRRKNKAILDQGWSMFRQMLAYKAAHRGGTIEAVPPEHTSTTCIRCRHCEPGNRPSADVFRCLRCGHQEQADIHAAKEILRRSAGGVRAGHARSACGGNVSPEQSGGAREAGTHRSDSAALRARLFAVGIPVL